MALKAENILVLEDLSRYARSVLRPSPTIEPTRACVDSTLAAPSSFVLSSAVKLGQYKLYTTVYCWLAVAILMLKMVLSDFGEVLAGRLSQSCD